MFAIVASMFQSCLKDQEDIFDDNGAVRSQEYLDNAKKVLTSSEHGWIFNYFPNRDIKFGGCVYTLKFEGSEVFARYEKKTTQKTPYIEANTEVKSLYSLCEDNGPTLTFDTYNELLHEFATPSSGAYQGKDGDFEFMIMEVADDVIKLRGKRTGNTMYLRRLTEPAEDYMAKVIASADNVFLTQAAGTIGSLQITADIDLDVRYLQVNWGEGQGDGNYFFPVPGGISFDEPIEVNGAKISQLNFDVDQLIYSGKDSNGNNISMTGFVPDDYTYFDEFAGDYMIIGREANFNTTLVADKDNNCYRFTGLNSKWDLIAQYNKSKGSLEIYTQELGVDNGRNIYFLMADETNDSGSFSFMTNFDGHFTIMKDLENPGDFKFIYNANGNQIQNSAMFYYYTGGMGTEPRGWAPTAWRPVTTEGKNNLGALAKPTRLVKR